MDVFFVGAVLCSAARMYLPSEQQPPKAHQIATRHISSCDWPLLCPCFSAWAGVTRSSGWHTSQPQMGRQLHPTQVLTALLPVCCFAGNSLDYTDKDMEIMTKHKAAVKEMEAGSIAWVAQLFHKPIFCIKAVTDIVDGDRPTQDEFLENLHTAAAALQQVLPKVLQFVSGKTLAEL